MTTQQHLLRDLRSQRQAIRWYQRRARELDQVARMALLGGLTGIAFAAEDGAHLARVAASRENSPEGGT